MQEIQNVLLVDDNRSTNFFNKKKLENYGYKNTVLSAGDGKEGLERFKGDAMPELVLLDINMPIMGGIEFLSTIREQEIVQPHIIIMMGAVLSDEKKKLINQYPKVHFVDGKMLSCETIMLIEERTKLKLCS